MVFGGPLLIALAAALDTQSATVGADLRLQRSRRSARTWLAFVRQRISVAIHFAAAKEIAEALKMTMATNSRDGGCRVRGG